MSLRHSDRGSVERRKQDPEELDAAKTPRPFNVIPNEIALPARVQVQRVMPVWMAKTRLLVLRGSKTPILVVYRHPSGYVMEETQMHVMLLGADTKVRVAGEKGMVIVSSRVRHNETWTLGFASSGQRKRMYELVKMWIELSSFLQSLTAFESIAKGHSSVVYRCQERENPQRWYSMKRVNRVKCCNEVEITERLANVDELQPYLARYMFMFEDSKDNSVNVIMKYYRGGSLTDRIRELGPLHETIVKSVLSSLCITLYLLHQHHVLHLDVKSSNILFDSESPWAFRNMKLIDFGSSRVQHPHGDDDPDADTDNNNNTIDAEAMAGTYGCMAPERFDGKCGPAADVYGAGVVLYHMVVGQLPFEGNDSYQVMAKNMQGLVHFDHPRWQHVSKPLRHLAEQMLQKDPTHRISLHQVLQLPWLFQRPSKKALRQSPLSVA